MADRVTAQQVKNAFEHFCATFGFKMSKGFNSKTRKNDPGLALDYNATYGGYEVISLNDENTGEGQPFGLSRMSPREFVQSLYFATRAAKAAQPGHHESLPRVRSKR